MRAAWAGREAAAMERIVIEPPDLAGAIGRRVHPGRPGAIVRYSAELLGAGLMAAYPWSREHGWSASN
jgi:hypothetical protein